MSPDGYWPSPWPGEDGGPLRLQTSSARPSLGMTGLDASLTIREAVATTMVVLRDPGEVFALRHTAGPDAVSWVERIDPVTLEPLARSVELAGGPTWPGGIAAHANGSLYVVFGNHAHRLDASLNVVASKTLPRDKPYNSFVILPDGSLVTKNFGGVLPFQAADTAAEVDTELVVLDPENLEIIADCVLPEASIARLSSDGDQVYVIGTSSLWRCNWDGAKFALDESLSSVYRSVPGQTYGWDPVIALGAVWFLDNGFGSERYIGTFRGQGVNTAPLHLVRVDLATAECTLTEICGLPNGVVANPPLIDVTRRIAVGFDSGNGVLAAFDIGDDGSTVLRWRKEQNHACHMMLFAKNGELFTTDHDADRMADEIVILDIETGRELLRTKSASPVQSVLFPAVGWDNDLYYCSFAGIARLGA